MSALADCILVVDDEGLIADLWCMVLEGMGMRVCGTAPTAALAIALAKEHRPRLVLMDLRLRGAQDGVDAALAITASVGSRIIFITGSRDPSAMAQIQSARPAAALFKPVSDRQLQAAITETWRLEDACRSEPVSRRAVTPAIEAA